MPRVGAKGKIMLKPIPSYFLHITSTNDKARIPVSKEVYDGFNQISMPFSLYEVMISFTDTVGRTYHLNPAHIVSIVTEEVQ